MNMVWGRFWQMSRSRLKAAWLITAGLLAFYVGVLQPMQPDGISSSRETGLAAQAGMPTALWRQARPMAIMLQKGRTEGFIGGVPGIAASRRDTYVAASFDSDALPPPPPPPSEAAEDRKTVRTGSLDMVVKNPHDSSEKIRAIAEHEGGFLVSAESDGSEGDSSAAITVRVPAKQFEEVRAAIRNLGLRVEGEKLNAEDVTKQYVDRSAQLRNLRAQEAQYLSILKQARTVKDTVEVSDKLNEVRGEIEQQQAEFDALSKQVETIVLSVSLRAEADTQVFGLHWRPLYQLKYAAREGIESLGDYAARMAAFLFYLPAVLLWLATILIAAAAGWRLVRWAGRILFISRVKAV